MEDHDGPCTGSDANTVPGTGWFVFIRSVMPQLLALYLASQIKDVKKNVPTRLGHGIEKNKCHFLNKRMI